jgi:uncharacterized cupredoxin-like copper-binding protein
MPRPTPFTAACATAALALTGCGDPDAVSTDKPIVRITVDEYRIVPQNILVKRGPARIARLKIAVRNTGRLTHNLVIQMPPKKFRARPVEVHRVRTMQPGEEGEPIKVALKPGTYRLVCTIANHDDLGQTGELEVKE